MIKKPLPSSASPLGFYTTIDRPVPSGYERCLAHSSVRVARGFSLEERRDGRKEGHQSFFQLFYLKLGPSGVSSVGERGVDPMGACQRKRAGSCRGDIGTISCSGRTVLPASGYPFLGESSEL